MLFNKRSTIDYPDALQGFSEEDIASSIVAVHDEAGKVPGAHAALLDVFKSISNTFDAEAYAQLLADEEVRADFYRRLSEFSRTFTVALASLGKALVMRRPRAGLIHHSDRGSQYCSVDYQAALKKHRIRISMSGKGNCYDNAMVETFFKTLKSELIWRTIFLTRTEAKDAIGRYIDGFYNPVRRHSALDFISPVQFEKLAAN